MGIVCSLLLARKKSPPATVDPKAMAGTQNNTALPSAGGITIKTAPHKANAISTQYRSPVVTAEALLKGSCSKKSSECKELLQSSFQPHFSDPVSSPLYASSNGFVHGAIEAYNQHHHLVIRPEDVWFAIMTQFGYYVNTHAEDLRGQFVAHQGKKELKITMVGTRYTVDFGWFAEEMGRLLEKNVVDAELRDWILPSFSTTTRDDGVVASILMMGTLQKYFEYYCGLVCGLPSVTLLGTKEDWENILLRLEKLKQYGEGTTIWYHLLKPYVPLYFFRPSPQLSTPCPGFKRRYQSS